MIEYLESNTEVFYAVFAAIFVFNLLYFYIGGHRAEKKFRGLQQQTIRFREKGASGRSHKSLITKFGGASRVLDVIVTDDELWVKGIWPMFTYIGTKYDLTRRVHLAQIESARVEKSRVFLVIGKELGAQSSIELQLRNPRDFVRAIRT